MYEHLLVGLDGSHTAERVLEHAQALATAFGSTVTLLRATMSPETLMAETANTGQTGDIGGIIDPTPILAADRDETGAYLSDLQQRLQHHGLTVDVVQPEGPAAAALVEHARSRAVSLILLTTHGRGGLGRIVFGSVADSVLRHAPCPVLLVRVTEDQADDAPSASDEPAGQANPS